ncbi:MAG: DUF370 domain-containing protein [Clostridiales bacterium]|jgi:regulator of extracellular matrix RemA (YlzA/DUF370 family)|nr:DUF370 domain-containing protein [Clostridiales bacterium]
MQLLNIGYGSFLSKEKILVILTPDSAPIKRIIQDSRERGLLIDASFGRKTKSVIVMDSSHVILSALAPEQLIIRSSEKNEE